MTTGHLHNVTIFPASLLPIAEELKAIGRSMPPGTSLIVPPVTQGPAWDVLVGFAYHELDCHGRIAEVEEVDSAFIERGVM